MDKNSTHIDNLIARYLSGEASGEERAELEDWMEESGENKKTFGDIRFVHDKAVASHRIVKVDVDKAWRNVNQRMKSVAPGQPAKTSRPVHRLLPPARVAAALVMVIGVSFLLYLSHSPGAGSQETTIVAGANGTVQHSLPDSSRVVLRANTKLTYTPGYGKEQREVVLSGEAYFDVLHDDARPFMVKVEDLLVKDIGTSFTVRALPGSPTVEVSVHAGKVQLYTAGKPGVVLAQGQAITYEKATKIFRRQDSVPGTTPAKALHFEFQDATLADVISQLAPGYKTSIKLGNDKLSTCKISVTFDNEDIDSIIGIIAETLGLRVVRTPDGYLLDEARNTTPR